MIHIIKNYKWVIATSPICILFGLLTFFTFINQSFIALSNFKLQILLVADLVLLVLFFGLIIYETYKISKERKEDKLGSETTLRYIFFFSARIQLTQKLLCIAIKKSRQSGKVTFKTMHLSTNQKIGYAAPSGIFFWLCLA